MARTKDRFDVVRRLGGQLPDVEEGTTYGSPALKLHGRLLACLAINKSAEPDSLVVRTGFEERAALVSEQPETYYVTDHYVKHPVVLVRLNQIRDDQLRDLLKCAWRFVTADASRKSRNAARPEMETGAKPRRAKSPLQGI